MRERGINFWIECAAGRHIAAGSCGDALLHMGGMRRKSASRKKAVMEPPPIEEKGDGFLGNLAKELMAELECETVFTIPVLGGIGISESVVVTWIIMAVLILFSIWLTRDLKVDHISRRQAVAELLVTKLTGLVDGMMCPEGKAFVPYLSTVLLYIGISNIIGLFGFKPPTKDLTVTLTLALMSLLLVEIAGIYYRGIKKWAFQFVNPINVLDLFTRPLSLCMRLFGNVLGAFVIMEMLKIVVPYVVPAVFSVYFDLFDGLLQAYVFVFLTALYLNEAIE